MSHAASGRHRVTKPTHRRTSSTVRVVLSVGGVALVAGAALLLWPRDSSAPTTATSPEPSGSGTTPSPSASVPASTVETRRDITLDGRTVTVEEVSTVTDGDAVRAAPAGGTPLGLELIDAAVVTPDGRAAPFNSAITVTASGSLTVRSRYRLIECPDILPAQWPSPVDFPTATRTVVELDGPLLTAYAICPDDKGRAANLPGLSGVMLNVTQVRLSWSGAKPLTITAIGSASGVAALDPVPDCAASCIATIAQGGSADVHIEPVDPCPPATTSDRLTLVTTVDGNQATVVALEVPGLHRSICR